MAARVLLKPGWRREVSVSLIVHWNLIMWLVLRYLILALVFVPALTLLVAAKPQDTGAEAVSHDCASQVADATGC